jgi:hypothetical protein
MAREITRYVDVAITKETALLQATGFGIPILLTDDVTTLPIATRVKEYLSLAAVEVDFADTTDEYKAAKAYFNQDPFNKKHPEKLLIGSWDKGGAEDIADALQDIIDTNDTWYAMGTVAGLRTDETNLELLATEIEALRKVLILCSNNADSYDSASTTDLLYVLKNKDTSGYKRTMIIYHDDATLYPDWSIMGKFLPIDPGSSQIAYQILAGTSAGATFIDAADITSVNKDNLFAKNGNTIVEVAGQTFIYPGTMVGGKNIDREGEWFDIIRSIDYMQARVEEGLLSLMLEKANDASKIPFTNDGIGLVRTRLGDKLNDMVEAGILVEDSIVITTPTRDEVSTDNRDDRILPDVDFNAELAGAIQKIVVRGKVRV